MKHLFAALICVSAGALLAADAPTVRATLQPEADRKAAPEFALKNEKGKTLQLAKYRGKVVLLDFWATWCHGCKEEIPWFAEFQERYKKQGLQVIGASMDDDGWKVVKPFLANAKIPYPIIVADKAMAADYKIETMPDAFLIDRKGRLAAVYVGLVDKENIEANIRSMLSVR